ncbi:hypothetical protein ZHAS_00004329 [Anopheles sinensis]|uniref:Uncharacterized protein n=1 Tax=Anopheles sinensis TaxID=74873 RepID=A0A084VGL0_ANOSI|nr:hypothetical protein ZHAS_00004329 [Anopheles sinensis]
MVSPDDVKDMTKLRFIMGEFSCRTGRQWSGCGNARKTSLDSNGQRFANSMDAGSDSRREQELKIEHEIGT